MSQIRVSCVQMRSGTDVAENIAAASALIREAAGQGAELIATPEMTTLLDRKPAPPGRNPPPRRPIRASRPSARWRRSSASRC